MGMVNLESLQKIMSPFSKKKNIKVRFDQHKAIFALNNLDKVLAHMSETRMNRNEKHLIPALKYAKSYGRVEGMSMPYKVVGGWGRLQRAHKSARSYIEISRPVRHFLARDIYTDVDVVNCHPILIEQLFPLLVGSESKALKLWNEKRDDIFKAMMAINPELSRDDCKKIGFCFLYDGDLSYNFEKLRLDTDNSVVHRICQEIETDIALLCARIQTMFPEQWGSIPVPARNASKPDRITASKFSRFIQHIERHVMLLCADSAVTMGLEVGDYSHDGLMVTSAGALPSEHDLSLFIDTAIAKVKASTGFVIELKVKDMPLPEWGETYVDHLDDVVSVDGIREYLVYENFDRLQRRDLFEIEINLTDSWKECTKDLNEGEINKFSNIYFRKYWVKVDDLWYPINCENNRINDNDYNIVGNGKQMMMVKFMGTPFQDLTCKAYDKIHFGPIPEGCNYYPVFSPNYDPLCTDDLTDEEISMISPMINHILHIYCKDNEEYFNYLCTLLGMKLRFPFEITRYPVVLVLLGEPGSGKSTPIHTLLKEAFGVRFMGKPKNFETMMGSEFNGETIYDLVSICDEIPPMKGTRDSAWNDFKTLVTEPQRVLHRKGSTRLKVNNYVSNFMFTNYSNAIKAESGCRRLFMLEISNECIGNDIYFRDLVKNIETHYKLICRYFMSFTKGVNKMESPPMTPWKEYATKYSLDVFGQFIHDSLEQDRNCFCRNIMKTEMAAMFKDYCQTSGQRYTKTNQEIYRGLVRYIALNKMGGKELFCVGPSEVAALGLKVNLAFLNCAI